MRERIASKMNEIKDKGLVGLPEDVEVNQILEQNGVAPVHRQGGDVGLEKFGFSEAFSGSEQVQKNTADSGVKYSLYEFVQDGRRYVEIDQDQSRFEGFGVADYPRIAKDIINEKFNGKVIGIDNKMFVNGAGRDEFANPSKHISDDVYKVKMRTAGELDNLLDAGTNFRNAPDGADGHFHKDVIGGFDYFDTLFKIGNRYFEAVINIKNVAKGKLFKDVTKIKDVTQDIMSSYGDNPKSQFLRTSSINSIPQTEKNVKPVTGTEEVQYSLTNDTAYMDKAIAKNKSSFLVNDSVLTEAKAVRERIASKMNEIKDKGLVGLPEDVEVNQILEQNGVAPVHRQGGDVGLEKFGIEQAQKSTTDSGVKYSLEQYSNAQKENWKKSKKIVVYENDAQLLQFVKESIANKDAANKMLLGVITGDLAARIKADTGLDFDGKNAVIRAKNVRKILLHDHGNTEAESLRGQIAVIDTDFLAIKDVFGSPDEIRLEPGGYNGKPAATFEKVIGPKKYTMFVVDSGGSLDIFVQTMYIHKSKKGSIANVANANALTSTPVATVGTAPDKNVAQEDANVNTQFSLSDSDGKALSKEQQNFFKDSKVRDKKGSLKVMYHGTPNGDFTVFKEGTYFTDNNLIEANGQKFQINKTTNDEFRRSESATKLMESSPVVYNDKLKAIANADEILTAAKNWIGEEAKHNRKDDIVEFGRGNVMYRVGKNGYVADVLVGIRKNGAAVLYDLVNIYETNIAEAPVAMASNDNSQHRQDASANSKIPQDGKFVKPMAETEEVQYSLTNDTAYMDKAIAKNKTSFLVKDSYILYNIDFSYRYHPDIVLDTIAE